MATFVRRDIWNLEDEGGPWHPIIRAFADAVGVMKRRSQADPRRPDRLGLPGERARGGQPGAPPTPSSTSASTAAGSSCPGTASTCTGSRRSCAPSSARSCPAVSQEVRDTWALPYWDYSRGGQDDQWRTLPHAFRTPTKDDGTANPLFTASPQHHARPEHQRRRPARRPVRLDPRARRAVVLPAPAPRQHQRLRRPRHRLAPRPRPRGPAGDHPARRRAHQRRRSRRPDGELRHRPARPGVLAAPRQHRPAVGGLAQPGRRPSPRTRRTRAGWTSRSRSATTPARRRTRDGPRGRCSTPSPTWATPTRWSTGSPPTRKRCHGCLPHLLPQPPQPGPDHPPELVGATTEPVQLAGDRAAVSVDVGEAAGPAAPRRPGRPRPGGVPADRRRPRRRRTRASRTRCT